MARIKHGGADYGGQVISRTVNHNGVPWSYRTRKEAYSRRQHGVSVAAVS